MTDLGTVLEAVNVVKGLGEVGRMMSSKEEQNLGRRQKSVRKAKQSGDGWASDFSDMFETSKPSVANKAPACYQNAMEQMAKLEGLKEKVAYVAKVNQSDFLQAAEKARAFAYHATSGNLLGFLHNAIPEPPEPLENLVKKEIEVMAVMQKQVSQAVHHSTAEVNKLESYDTELLLQFDKAKKELGMLEQKLVKTESAEKELAQTLSGTALEHPDYVQMQIKLNNLKRTEKDTKNGLELSGQEVVDVYKQGSQVRAKEDVVRAALHELKLVNSYVSRFL
jgi:hypothetical protein